MVPASLGRLTFAAGLLSVAACSSTPPTVAPSPTADPRVGLSAGLYNAGVAVGNLKVLANVPSVGQFAGSTNSDITFTGKYAIQGNYNGFQVYDISTPSRPTLVTSYYCPASQSDVSVYKNLLFVSGEGTGGRIDCGGQGAPGPVNKDRLRGIRVFDITDITKPKYVANVQTCRGSHTHTVLESPSDRENVYIYVSGSAGVRSADELPGCISAPPSADANSALFRIEVIKVPLANPERAAIVSSPRIFNDLVAPPRHGEAAEDVEANRRQLAEARAKGMFIGSFGTQEFVLPPNMTNPMLDSVVKARGGAGLAVATAADSTALRAALPAILAKMFGAPPATPNANPNAPRPGPTQCHDITVYPALGLAGGACEGYGLLLDISDPVNPRRIGAVADSNFAYWHSATFNNDGTKILFSDEWGGGGGPKCRASDKKEWGANAIFSVVNRKMEFESYYKLPAAQTANENCVAHNGSLIPIPGRDVMVQSWYQGGVTVFDWTDAKNPKEIAFFDRGPIDATRMASGGTWSVYWYNGAMYSSEMARGLDVVELTPSEFISQNEIDAAKTVHYEYLNAQGQPKMSWPPSFALARAYVDQLERSNCLGASRIAGVRAGLSTAERSSGSERSTTLNQMAAQLASDARSSCDGAKVSKLESAVKDLGGLQP